MKTNFTLKALILIVFCGFLFSSCENELKNEDLEAFEPLSAELIATLQNSVEAHSSKTRDAANFGFDFPLNFQEDGRLVVIDRMEMLADFMRNISDRNKVSLQFPVAMATMSKSKHTLFSSQEFENELDSYDQARIVERFDCCDNIEGKPSKLILGYFGGGCAQDDNAQGDKSDCEGGVGYASSVHVKISTKDDGSGDIYYDDQVSLGSAFAFDNDGEKLKSKFFIILNGGEEVIEMHASCSAPLRAGDRFGSMALLVLFTDENEVCDAFSGGNGSNEDCCEDIDGKPSEITLKFTGGGCAADDNSQEDKSDCDGGYTGSGPAHISVSEKEDGSGDILFSGEVALGESFTLSKGGKKLKSKLFVRVNGNEEKVEIHASCSVPLAIGDQFGSFELEGLRTDKDDTCGEPGDGGSGGNGGEDCCDSIDGKASEITFVLQGGGCAADNNSQDDKSDCMGGILGMGPFSVTVSEDDDGSGDIYFSGTVSIGESFTISNNGDKLSSKFFVILNDGQENIEIHASCSAPLVIGDRFGSLELEGLRTDEGDICGNPGESENPGGGDGEDCCDSIDGRSSEMTFVLQGGGCAADNNSQDDKSDCMGGITGAGPFSITVSEDDDGSGDIYFTGTVALGESFKLTNNGDKFNSKFFVNINGGQEIVEIHASCSAPLVIGDRFGSLELQGLRTDEGDICGDPDSIGGGSGEDCCETLNGEPSELFFEFVGGGCAADDNSQSNASDCEGGFNGSGPVSIVASEDIFANGEIYFNGNVAVGEFFSITDDGQPLGTRVFININDGEEVLEINTSCSPPLIIGERFGSLELVGVVSLQGDVCGSITP